MPPFTLSRGTSQTQCLKTARPVLLAAGGTALACVLLLQVIDLSGGGQGGSLSSVFTSGGSSSSASSRGSGGSACAPCPVAAAAAAGAAAKDDRIPKILHRIYLSGREEFEGLRASQNSAIRPEWADWCEAVHHGWEVKFWDDAAARKLIEEDYPSFLPTWEKYDRVVSRGDALRYFALHKYGGVYIDLDTECFREGYDLLRGADVVLQATDEGEGYTNAAMASAPGHKVRQLWEKAFEILPGRVGGYAVHATGPGVVNTAVGVLGLVKRKEGVAEGVDARAGDHAWEGTVVRVFPLGEWFTPCFWDWRECHRDLAIARSAGMYNSTVVGYHHYTGTWNRASDNDTMDTPVPFQVGVKAAICDNAPLAWGGR